MEPATPALGALSPLPVEIRLQIFRLVLQRHSKSIKPVRRGTLEKFLGWDTALFVVSREISQEAQDAFFEIHTVVITGIELTSQSIPLFRHIEIRRSTDLPFWPATIVLACSKKLRTVTFARDSIPHSSTCIGVGLFKIDLDQCPNYEIFVKDIKLHKLLPKSRKLIKKELLLDLFVNQCHSRYHIKYREISQADLDDGFTLGESSVCSLGEAMYDLDIANRRASQQAMTAPSGLGHQSTYHLRSEWHDGIVCVKAVWEGAGEVEVRVVRSNVYAHDEPLAWWLAAYDKFRAREAGEVLSLMGDVLVDKWYSTYLYQSHGIQRTHERLPVGVRLEDLDVAQHGSEVVEWATELIGLNMRCIGGSQDGRWAW